MLSRTSSWTGTRRCSWLSPATLASSLSTIIAPAAAKSGWTVLSGKELNPDGLVAKGAAGDTIVNAKLGVRIGFGAPTPGSPYPTRSDLYIGYGRALTGEVWYKDILRMEYRLFF